MKNVNMIFYFSLLLMLFSGPAVTVFFKENPLLSAKILSRTVWVGFIVALVGRFFLIPQQFSPVSAVFQVTPLSWIIAILVLFIGGIIHSFSIRYFDGARRYFSIFLSFNLSTLLILIEVITDHMLFLFIFSYLSSLLLCRLMVHQPRWTAAKASGALAFKTLAAGHGLFLVGILFLFKHYKTWSLSAMTTRSTSFSFEQVLGLFFIAVAALIRSANWPFHRWLKNSVNSPTPVSAFMHAGLVNGGGIIMLRFAPLLIDYPLLLQTIFIIGLLSALLGTVWKLLQSTIKSTLAFSTIAQMGFMMMQCGMGLFPAALSHLFWHGIYKCHQFLRSGSALFDEKPPNGSRNGYFPLLLSILGGFFAVLGLDSLDLSGRTDSFLLNLLVWMSGAQIIYDGLNQSSLLIQFLKAIPLVFLGGLFYSVNIFCIEKALFPFVFPKIEPSSSVYYFGTGLLLLSWFLKNLVPLLSRQGSGKIIKAFYVFTLNRSQPERRTLTLKRHHYRA
ncbi:MAG: proton-conducting transporter membrane subunit [Chlamydiota bacterium]